MMAIWLKPDMIELKLRTLPSLEETFWLKPTVVRLKPNRGGQNHL
jgi:hypothetical protein